MDQNWCKHRNMFQQ